MLNKVSILFEKAKLFEILNIKNISSKKFYCSKYKKSKSIRKTEY
jgi:hypothetical protein